MSGIFKSVKIKQTKVCDNSYVMYRVDLSTKDTNWSLWRRFSDFTALNEKIKDAYNVPPMPPKQMFGKTSAALTEQRRKMLEHYLYVLLLENDSTVAENPHVIRFFELTGKLNTNTLESRINNWCRECEDMTNLANEISANLQERKKMAEQGEEDADLVLSIRRKTQSLNTKIDALGATLVEAENSGGLLTDAEILRRRNMLQTLIGRRDELIRMERSGPSVTGYQRSQLIASPGGGRVWGKETAATVDKDNKALLQSQRAAMAEQDDGLDKLSAIVQRQKMIARSIGQELEEQNKMLDDLDNRVERTNVHLGKTTKGVMKLL